MDYVTLSGPALATVSSKVSYLSLMNITGDPYALASITNDKTNKSIKLALQNNLSVLADAVAVLNFLKSVVNQNGGQDVVAVNSQALTFAAVLKVAYASTNTDIATALSSLTIALNVVGSVANKAGIFNNARYLNGNIANVSVDMLANASSASMVISKA